MERGIKETIHSMILLTLAAKPSVRQMARLIMWCTSQT